MRERVSKAGERKEERGKERRENRRRQELERHEGGERKGEERERQERRNAYLSGFVQRVVDDDSRDVTQYEGH